MSLRLVLPPPPKDYSLEYERIRNREIERVVNSKIGANQSNVFGGVPFTSVRGSAAVFTIPQGNTPIKLPFNTLSKDTDPDVVFDPVGYTMSNPFEMDCIFFVNLRHATAPGGSYDFTLQAFNHGVAIQPAYTQTISNNVTQDIRIARFVVNFPADNLIDLRAFHNRNGNVDLNMQLSQWDIMRMSPYPGLQEA
jgi:hypothetical protein